ncbi:metallophosphoesterase [Streptococcus parauberis]|uniref:metallophosphoesterase n=1 Tax=Streptococcus parauberis TaxID=1348 RepID=UPI000CCE9A98|nr:metallophosphoesterase [Streptococcus parauberis]PNY19455.1 Calcineurin-like phosphoesterase superfamily domain protein [Streptococcus parauberis]
MKKLAIMSDLHIDINQFSQEDIDCLNQVLHDQNIDHLHLAGDISNHYERQTLPFFQEIDSRVTISHNLGNHDLLDISEDRIEELDFQVIPLSGQVTLVAFHGWYDYSYFPERSIAENITFKNTFWFDRRLKRPLSDIDLTQRSCQNLEETLASLSGDIIISMHFVPHSDFILQHPKLLPFNAFLGSQKFHDIFQKYRVKTVYFGHNHHRMVPQQIDDVTYHSRPLGYQKEWKISNDFLVKHPDLIPEDFWNLNKRFAAIRRLPEFENFRKQELAKEFQSAMSIFEIEDEKDNDY